jgi:hypothetical protein
MHEELIERIEIRTAGSERHLLPYHYTDLFQREHAKRITPYMDKQTEITPYCRAIAIDWLFAVVADFGFTFQSLSYAVYYLDKFSSITQLTKKNYQKYAAACLLIGTKVEEYWVSLEQLAYLSDESFTAEELRQAESEVLQKIDWDVHPTTAYHLFPLWATAVEEVIPQMGSINIFFNLVRYLTILSLISYKITTNYRPSEIAASATFLAIRILTHKTQWPAVLVYYTGFSMKDLQNCVQDLTGLQLEAQRVELEPWKLFKQDHHYNVATLFPVPEQKVRKPRFPPTVSKIFKKQYTKRLCKSGSRQWSPYLWIGRIRKNFADVARVVSLNPKRLLRVLDNLLLGSRKRYIEPINKLQEHLGHTS